MPKISDLFILDYGHSLELNRLEQSIAPDSINFVGRAARNNGVTARVRPINGIKPAAIGTISVALGGQGGAGVAFLQPSPYYCGRDVMVLTPRKPMTEQEKLWWVTCITANRFRFGFGRQANRTLKDLALPPLADMPTWVENTTPDSYKGAELPASAITVKLDDIARWAPFTLQDLFIIRKGQRLTKANMLPGDTPYIGASDTSNGITARVGQTPIHTSGTISVSYNGSVAEAFYQPEPYWATDDVNVLYPKNFKLTAPIALFICTMIRMEKYRFNYGRKWHLERMRESVIKLPVTHSGAPDWDHMADYINTLSYSSQID
ncbi:restriction endonuclease subunit S [Pseudomonas lutea]|uniref:Restriction endonuclease subunit S n=1 Tax=Pseudomonas lutea TaxID=243924 RepID=A0ABR9ACK9_9PSED|nr:restriction endonuclease subunit S [Pseudomonas lutea]MBD8123852.1 restriction endonuclease subunit S [Pseudomonas lutea]